MIEMQRLHVKFENLVLKDFDRRIKNSHGCSQSVQSDEQNLFRQISKCRKLQSQQELPHGQLNTRKTCKDIVS